MSLCAAREGDPIVIEADDGRIKVRRQQRVPTLKELVGQITPKNRYGEIPSGPARGKESDRVVAQNADRSVRATRSSLEKLSSPLCGLILCILLIAIRK
jgi:antitoxin component of MazEF toxin-antitoxin module